MLGLDRDFILAVEEAIEATFSEADWKRLGYETGTAGWITNHDRLLRSLNWGDDDYGSHVFDAIEHILGQDDENLGRILRVPKIERWFKRNRPKLFAKYYGDSALIEESAARAEEAGRGFDIHDHIRRIREAQGHDPALALGSTKELLESIFKEILGLYGPKSSMDDFPGLWKRVQDKLGLSPGSVSAAAPGADSLRRLLGSMTQIVISVNELRNLYGTGHGNANSANFDEDAMYVAVNSGITVATYLMRKFEALKSSGSPN